MIPGRASIAGGLSLLGVALLSACDTKSAVPDSEAARADVPVEVAAAARSTAPMEVRRSATLRSRVDTQLVTESAGLVVSRPVPAGSAVKKGEVIARLSSIAETAALKAARGRLAGLIQDGVTLAARQQAEAMVQQAEESLRMRTVVAPADGTMDSYHIEVGDYATPGSPVGRLVDASKLWVVPTVLEDEVLGVELGSPVALTVPAWPEVKFKGTIVRRGAAALPGSGQFELEVDVDPDTRLMPGFVATVSIPVKGSQTRLLVPRDALFQRHGTWRVFVAATETGTVRARERAVRIRPVPWRPDLADVIQGLDPGVRVVTRGRIGLVDGDPLRVTER